MWQHTLIFYMGGLTQSDFPQRTSLHRYTVVFRDKRVLESSGNLLDEVDCSIQKAVSFPIASFQL